MRKCKAADVLWKEKRVLEWKNEKKSSFVWSAIGLLQMYADNTTSGMKRGALFMSVVHSVLLICSVNHPQNFIYNWHTLVELLPVLYDVGGDSRQEFEEVETSDMRGSVSKFSEIVAVEDWTIRTKSWRGCDEKIRIVRNGMPILLDGLHTHRMKTLRWLGWVIFNGSFLQLWYRFLWHTWGKTYLVYITGLRLVRP